MLEAIMFGHDEIKRLIAFQEEIVAAVGKEKSEIKLYEIDEELSEKVKALAEQDLLKAIQVHEKHAREDAINEVKTQLWQNSRMMSMTRKQSNKSNRFCPSLSKMKCAALLLKRK